MDKFSLNSDPTIQNPDGRVIKKEWLKVYPVANRTGDNFVSNCQFEFQNSGKQYFVPSQSYIQIKLKLCGLSGGTGTANETLLRDTSGIYPAFNIGAQFWTTYSHQINNIVVDRADQLSQTDTCAKRLFVADDARKTWGQVSCLEPNRTTRLLNSGYDVSGYNAGSVINDIVWRPSLGLFATGEYIPPTARHLLEFVVDANWKRKVVEATLSNVAPDVSTGYKVEVQEIIFYACMMSGDVPTANGNHYIQFGASECQFQALTSTTNNLFYQLKPSTNKISTFVQSALVGSNTLFSSGILDGSGQSLNQTLVPRQAFGTSIQPQPDIDLASTSVGTAGGTQSVQYNFRRAYYDMAQTQYWTEEDNGNESYADWLKLGAIFSYKHCRAPDDQSSSLMVYSTYNTTPNNLNLWVYSQYDRILNLTYQNGNLVAVQVEDV